MTKIQENCLYSYELTCQKIDGVELDIICDKENQLVINHDFYIHDTNQHINQLTTKEFKQIKFNQNTIKPKTEQRCTFQEVLNNMKENKIIDCEVKYPTITYPNNYPTRDSIVQILLKELQNHDNQLFFSSFDPLICLLLRYSQQQYPVYLLHSSDGVMDFDVDNTWAVPRQIEEGVKFINKFNLYGIVTRQSYVDNHQEILTELHKTNKYLITWGSIYGKETIGRADGYIHDCVQ